MNVWLIGGGIYAVASLFALALCRVAAPTHEGGTQRSTGASEPSQNHTEYELVIGLGEDRSDASVHRETPQDLLCEVPDSRPSARSRRSSQLRKAPQGPQPTPSAEIAPTSRSLNRREPGLSRRS